MKKSRIPSKHQTLIHFIETADSNCISRYYSDSFFSTTPNLLLQNYIRELAEDGYVKPRLRHVLLTTKAYSYIHDLRIARFYKILEILGRPISYLISWGLGILSAVIVQHLLNLMVQQP
mgnify:CR=1 FL=1